MKENRPRSFPTERCRSPALLIMPVKRPTVAAVAVGRQTPGHAGANMEMMEFRHERSRIGLHGSCLPPDPKYGLGTMTHLLLHGQTQGGRRADSR